MRTDAERLAPVGDDALAAAATRIRAAGLRATAPRTRVYAALRVAGGHRSVDELAELLGRGGSVVPRMTIYNVVADLERAGLVMCADVGPGRALYEASDEWHHHFVCRVCRRVWDVPCAVGHKPCLDPSIALPADVDEAQVIFRGRCASCATSAEAGPA